MKKILTFGELLIRLQATSSNFIQHNNSSTIEAFAGGSEANVSVALGRLGIPVSFFTAVPDTAITQEIITILKNNNVDTSKMLFTGDRVGMYILLSANGLTRGDVIYDRKYSSFSQLQAADIDWDLLFNDCCWLHWTALTPSLSEEMAMLMKVALEEAVKRNIIISVDLNYRSKLWQYGKEPVSVMPQLVKNCDIIMGNIWAANKMLGTAIDLDLDRKTPKNRYVEYASEVAAEIFSLYPKCMHVANTFRFMDNPSHNLFYATYHVPGHNYVSDTFETKQLVDRIGSGDAFMGGLIYGIYKEYEPQEIIDIATRVGFDKLFTPGDFLN
jgi:2-dehydro-3-deoxygluconokinase